MVLSLYLSRVSFDLGCSRKLRFQGRSHDKVPQFCKFKLADGRHSEIIIVFRLYLDDLLSD